MKPLILVIALIWSVSSYSLWDNWHNVPTPWLSTMSDVQSNLTTWTRNTPLTPHYSGYFSNFSMIIYQYMYWKKSNPNQLLFCKPKYYLYSETLCRRNPRYWSSNQSQFCVPNSYGIKSMPSFCTEEYSAQKNIECCFKNQITQLVLKFQQNFFAVDPYSTPLL